MEETALLTVEQVAAVSPLLDRMGTSEGRACAVDALRRLGEDRDEAEQRASGARLRQAPAGSRVTMRRWDPKTGNRRD